jgi:competence protein ComGC
MFHNVILLSLLPLLVVFNMAKNLQQATNPSTSTSTVSVVEFQLLFDHTNVDNFGPDNVEVSTDMKTKKKKKKVATGKTKKNNNTNV